MLPSPGAAPPPPLQAGEPSSHGAPGAPPFAAPHFVQSHVVPHMPLQMPHAVQRMAHMPMPMPQMPQMPMPMPVPVAEAEHFHANDWPPTAAPFGGQGFGGGFGGEGYGGEGFGDGFGGEGFDGGGGGGASFTDAAADPFAGPTMGAAAAPDPFGRFGAASESGYRSGLD